MATNLLSLGDLYISDFLAPGEQPRSEPWPLDLVMDDDTGLVHLTEQPPPELMWGERYWYHSGINESMVRDLRDVVDGVHDHKPVKDGQLWLDIASNDGTLLAQVSDRLRRVGIDPADDTFAREARKHADVIVQQPFSLEAWHSTLFGPWRADVITCVAMFYDLMDPAQFLADVREVLADDGLFVLQLSYTPLMLNQLAFDNICHEHARYYTLQTLELELRAAGLWVVDAELNSVNGGSLRVYVTKDGHDPYNGGPARDVAEARIDALRSYEHENGYNELDVWVDFADRVEKLRTEVVGFIESVVDAGATVYALGASTKGNTLLQAWQLDHTLITAAGERSPFKVGLRTVGTDIPIVDEDTMRHALPDYLLALPWAFRTSLLQREADYLKGGGKIIFPCPHFEVIGG